MDNFSDACSYLINPYPNPLFESPFDALTSLHDITAIAIDIHTTNNCSIYFDEFTEIGGKYALLLEHKKHLDSQQISKIMYQEQLNANLFLTLYRL